MIELSPAQLDKMLEAPNLFVVYFYTPFCGTCKLAERMLEIVQAMRPELIIYKSDINYVPEKAQKWQISSVPCITFFANQRVLHQEYRMESVEHVSNLFARFMI